MKKLLPYLFNILLTMMFTTATMAQGVVDVNSHITTPERVSALGNDGMLFRLAEIEVYPEYLEEYLSFAGEIQKASLAEEPGVVCLFPTHLKEDSTQIRILEIYASQQAYQHHIQTAHFLKYKEGTLHMVKQLKLQDLQPLTPEVMHMIFKR